MPTLNGPLRGAQFEARVRTTEDPDIVGIFFLEKPEAGSDAPWDLVYHDGSSIRTLHDDAKAAVGGFRLEQVIRSFASVAAHEPSTPAPLAVDLQDNNLHEIGTPAQHLNKGGASVLRIEGFDPVLLFDDDILALSPSYSMEGETLTDTAKFTTVPMVRGGVLQKAALVLGRGRTNPDGSAPLLVARSSGFLSTTSPANDPELVLHPLSGTGGGKLPPEGIAQIAALIAAAKGDARVSNQNFKDALVSLLYTGTGAPPVSYLPDAKAGSIVVRSSDQAMFVKEAATERGVAIANRDTVSVQTGAGGVFRRGSAVGTNPTVNGVNRNPDWFVGEVQAARGTGQEANQYKWTIWALASALTGDDAPFTAVDSEDTASFLAAINSGSTLPDSRTDRVLFFRNAAARAKDKSLAGAAYQAFETRGFETSFGLTGGTQYNFKFFKDQRGDPAYVFPAQTEDSVPGGWMELVSTAANTALEVAHARPVSVMEQRGTGGATTLAVGATARDIEYALSYDPDSIDDEDELGLVFDPSSKRLTLSDVKQAEWMEIVGSCKFRHTGEAGTAVFKLVELRSNGSPVVGGETDLATRDLPAASSWATYHIPAIRTRARKRGGTDVFTFRVDFKRTSANPVATATSIQARTSTNHDTAVGFERTISRGVVNLQSKMIHFGDKSKGAFSSYSYVSDMPDHPAIQAAKAGDSLVVNAAKNAYEMKTVPDFSVAAADTDRALKLIVEETQESQQDGTPVVFTQDQSIAGRWVGTAAADPNLVVIFNTNSRVEGAGPAVPARSYVIGYPANLSSGQSGFNTMYDLIGGGSSQNSLIPVPSPTPQQNRWRTPTVHTVSGVDSDRTSHRIDLGRLDGTWLHGRAPVKTMRTITKEALQNVAKGAPAVNSPPSDAVEGTRVDLLVDWTEPRGKAVITLGVNSDHSFIGYLPPNVGSSDRTLSGIDWVGFARSVPGFNASLVGRFFVTRASNNAKTPTELWVGDTKYDLSSISTLPHYFRTGLSTSAGERWGAGNKVPINVKYSDNTWAVDPETVKKGIIAYTGFRWVDDSGVTSIIQSLVEAAALKANATTAWSDSKLKRWTGTQTQYDALAVKAADTLHFITGAAPAAASSGVNMKNELIATVTPQSVSGRARMTAPTISLATGITTKYPNMFSTASGYFYLWQFLAPQDTPILVPDDVIGIYLEGARGATRYNGLLLPRNLHGQQERSLPTSDDFENWSLLPLTRHTRVGIQTTWVYNGSADDTRRSRLAFYGDPSQARARYQSTDRIRIYFAR